MSTFKTFLTESEFKNSVMKEKDLYALVGDDFGKLVEKASKDFDIVFIQDGTRGIFGRYKSQNVLYFEFKSLFGWAHDKSSLNKLEE